MSDVGNAEPASTYLRAELDERQGSSAAKGWRRLANVVLALASGDAETSISNVDLVVRRRESGAEVLRVTAGTLREGDLLLTRVRDDLETKNVAEFLAEWRLPDDV